MTRYIISIALTFFFTSLTWAEDGHKLWLRMAGNESAIKIFNHTKNANPNDISNESKTLRIAISELQFYIREEVSIHIEVTENGSKHDGFALSRKGNDIYITSASSTGILYGAFHLIRLQEIGKMLKKGQTIEEIPSSDLRLLNHWDNINGTIERGYAGHSIFWSNKGDIIDQNTGLIGEYARANASIGINGTVLNNVNASPKMLSSEYIQRAQKVAHILRPYGIKVYLSVNFASPQALEEVKTADPLDKDVIKWWQNKVKEIYTVIPDFGGFLVKANSEGEPGPQDFGRTHVDGANMLADALKPYGGIVMWRAFVYAADSPDRACQAYDEFMPFDGKFHDNVILQVKNGPVDFQPREPVHPLFYSLKHTKVIPEFQITQEYLGGSVHSVYLSPMWKELTDEFKMSVGVAGVSNIGDSENWCGSDMAQANWYAFGRLAWNQNLSSEEIADEWLKQTFTSNKKFVNPMKKVMLASHEACVNYMMPMGIHHIFAGGHHYGPEPWYAPRGLRADWTPPYYHKAGVDGMGFDRTRKGSNNVSQYPEPLASMYNDINKCPEKYILWFHHVGWKHKLPCGETLWNRLCHKYDLGVREAESFAVTWEKMKPFVDSDRFNRLQQRYQRQAKDAWWWRDACLLYFQQFSNLPFPKDCPPARYDLKTLMQYHLDIGNYTAAPMDKLP